MKLHRLQRFFFYCFFITATFYIESCTSTPPLATEEDILVGQISVHDEGSEGVILSVENDRKGYFYFSSPAVLENAQNGSPQSIKKAVSLVRKADESYTNPEKVFVQLCTGIMSIAWPEYSLNWKSPSDLPVNLYLATIESANRGVYEPVHDTEDFFSLVLPSLVLCKDVPIDKFSENSRSSLEKAKSLNSDSILVLYLLGVLEYKSSQYEKALEYLSLVVPSVEDSQNAKMLWIDCLIKTGRLKEADAAAKVLIQKNPDNLDFLVLGAKTSFEVENYEVAESYISRVLQRDPNNTDCLLFRSKVLFELEEYLTVSSMLDIYERTGMSSKEYLLMRAKLLIRWNKNNVAASKTLSNALEKYGNDNEVLLAAAELASMWNQPVNGKSALQLALPILNDEPQNKKALQIILKELIQKNQWNEAFPYAETLYALDPLGETSVLLCVEFFLGKNLVEKAEQALTAVYKMTDEPSDELQKWYIRVLIAQEKVSVARGLIDSLLKDSSGQLKSILYYEKSRIDSTDAQKLSDLRSSLTNNPRNTDALYELYLYYFAKKDYRKAQYYLKQVLALNPYDDSIMQKNIDLEGLLGN